VSLAWRTPGADGLRGVQAGLWRGRSFPGGPAGPATPALQLHGGWGHLDAHVAAARLQPRGRGAAVASAGASAGAGGHVHGSLDCRATLQQRVCFDGRVDLLGASLQWASDSEVWLLAAGALRRQEHGALYAAGGDADYHGRQTGGWLDVVWQAPGPWSLATRLERLSPRHTLQGVGASAVARDANLLGAAAVDRVTVAALRSLPGELQLALEAGQERRADGRVRHVALRLVWRAADLLGGAW
jgi:hypothetical protein